MRNVNFFIIVFGASLTLVYVHSKPTRNHITFSLPNDITRVKRLNADSTTGYLEQCGIVTFLKAQKGVVNVLAFLDSSWPYSHRQAIMLKMLNERLQSSGLPDTLFFAVNVDPTSSRTIANAEDDIEREAWLGVSPEEIETLADIVTTTDSLVTNMTPDIQLIQDNEDLGIWKELRGSRDQVLVIDRCGKLTYQVIVPWSILHFPYVKAAILSTYKDDPCGPCDSNNSSIQDPLKHEDQVILETVTMGSDIGAVSTTEDYFQIEKETVMQISTPNAIESQSTSNYLTSEVIDIGTEAATTENFEDPENYTLDFNGEIEEEITASPSIALIPTEVSTKIETNSTDSTVTPRPLINYKIMSTTIENIFNPETTTAFELNDKSATSQNTILTNSKKNLVTDSMDITYSDPTESSYYDTTSGSITNNFDADREENMEHTTELFRVDDEAIALINNQNNSSENSSENVDTTIDSLYLDSILVTSKAKDSVTDENVEANTEETPNYTANAFQIEEELKDSEDRSNEYSEITENPLLSNFPLRIIMHAPHFHADGDSTRMHEYLVLMYGTSDHHRHLASYDATRLYRGFQDFHEAPEYHRSQEIEGKKWSMNNIIYNKDESPGLYGEVADYWKNSGGQDSYDYLEETERPGLEDNIEEPSADDSLMNMGSFTSNKYDQNTDESDKIVNEMKFTMFDETLDKTTELSEIFQSDFADESVTEVQPTNIEILYDEEEETRSKLIAHYSKLLPWIYYVLDK